MMRPMKLAGDRLLFGLDCLEHLKALSGKRAMIVKGRGTYLKDCGIQDKVCDYLEEAGMEIQIFSDVEPDPGFKTVLRGVRQMCEFGPDWIVALGGGSVMDAAKAMWIYYENPELTTLEEILPPNEIPKLRVKARLACIPSTAGSASEVSRSIVITDDKNGTKHGIGNMELMPDVAICDPEVTCSMTPSITAETGMDALTHAVEAYLSKRANYISDIFAIKAVKDIFIWLPKACADGRDMKNREQMLNASLVAGLAFTNVSLGIVHSIAHTLGSVFHLRHGLADAVVLPYVIRFNSQSAQAAARYAELARHIGEADFGEAVEMLGKQLKIPVDVGSLIGNRAAYEEKLNAMVRMALDDGCTKTNPVIPTAEQMKRLFLEIW